MKEAKEMSTPVKLNLKVSKEMSPREEMRVRPYRVRSLTYLSKATRPDIAFAAITLGRFCNDPGKQQWSLAKGVVK